MKDFSHMTFLEIVEEAVQLGGGDTSWLARMDEKDGFFVHIHRGTIRSDSGALVGFIVSAQGRDHNLDRCAALAAEAFYALIN